MAQAPLYRYCRPADGVLDSKGPLSRTIIALSILAEVNKEVKACHCWPEEKARFV